MTTSLAVLLLCDPEPPRYPPGFSVFLVPFALLGNDYLASIQHAVAFYAALYVAIAAAAAWSFKGPLAGALAATLIGTSPFLRAYSGLFMSDALAAALVIVVVFLLRQPTAGRIAWAGFLAGVTVTIRLPMVVALAALLFIIPPANRQRLLLCAAPPLATMPRYWLVHPSDRHAQSKDFSSPIRRRTAPASVCISRDSGTQSLRDVAAM
jgi:hypothetical protein